MTMDEDQDPFRDFFRPSFFDHLIGPLRQHSQMMNQQFSNLRQEAGQGKQVTEFSINGERYRKTCETVKIE